MNVNRLSVTEAARLLETSEDFIRSGLQSGLLPFGWAQKLSGRWTYVIPVPLFERCTGISPAPDPPETGDG